MIRKLCNLLIELGIIALIIFPPITFGAVLPYHIMLIQLLIVAIGLLWFVKALAKQSITYIATPLDLPLIGFLILGLLNYAFSIYRHNTEYALFMWMFYGVLYFLVIQQLQTLRRIVGLAFILTLTGSGEALFGIFQYLRGATTVLGLSTPNIGTVNATYFSHNHFAGFLILMIPIAAGLFVGSANLEKKGFLGLLIGLMGAAFVLTLSRGGFLSLGIASVLFFTCLIRKAARSRHWGGKYWIVGGILFFCIGVIGFVTWIGISPIAHRSLLNTILPTSKDMSNEVRFVLWRQALLLAKDFPLFGSGLGTFEYVFMRYRPENLPQNTLVDYLHNDYLELLIEMGIPALLLVAWGIIRWYRRLLPLYFQHHDPVLTGVLLGGLSSCTALLIHSCFDFNLQIPANATIFTIVLAMTIATANVLTQRSKVRRNGHADEDEPPHPEAVKRHHAGSQTRPSWKWWGSAVGFLLLIGFHFRKPLALNYFSKAQTLENQNQPFAAIPFYYKAMTIDGSNALFHGSLGRLYFELGRTTPYGEKWYQLAQQEFLNALARNAYQGDYYYALGWVYDGLDQEKQAIEAFKTAIAYDPHTAFYHEQLGNYLLYIRQSAAAMPAYREALRLAPNRLEAILKTCQTYKLTYQEYHQIIDDTKPESLMMFAFWLAQQQQWEESKRAYRKAIDVSGGSEKYYTAMIEACRQHADYECLRSLWRELAQQQPDKLEWSINIAESFVQQQLGEQAIAEYQTLLATVPENTQVQTRLAQLDQQYGRPAEAIAHYRQLLAQHPENTQLYHQIAALYQQQQQWSNALQTYETALANGQRAPDIYANLGQLYEQQGDKQHALALYEQAIQAGETRIEVYQKAEQFYQAEKRMTDVALLWETYIMHNHQNPGALFQLAQHYHAQKEWLKAVNLSKELIARSPTSAEYRKFLADLYEQQGMLVETIEQWEKLVSMQANNVEYHFYLATLYERTNATDKARSHYRTILRLQPNHPQAQERLNNLGG